MEYALEGCDGTAVEAFFAVLILVLMEYALEGTRTLFKGSLLAGLNPCFNGICSRSWIMQSQW